MYDTPKVLPLTGVGSITIGGLLLDQVGLLIAALGVVLVAATFIRFRFRPGKNVGDR